MSTIKKKVATFFVISVACSGCGLFKRSGAVDPAQLTKQLANSALLAPPSTNLGRNSAIGLYSRLDTLFPDAKYTQVGELAGPGAKIDNAPLLNATSFDPMQANGDMLSLSAENRPLTAVSQVTLNRISAQLCRQTGSNLNKDIYGVGVPSPRTIWATNDAGAIFSPADVLMPGESLPIKAAEPAGQYWAFVVARNAYLYPYTVDSIEIQTLAALYNQIYQMRLAIGDAARAKNGAQSAICEAALNSPQFLMGTPGKLDVVRRVAQELGNRRPSFAEIGNIASGGSLSDWVTKVQSEPGYVRAVNRWHRDWLGLRDFQVGNDPRPASDLSLLDYHSHNNYDSQFGGGFYQVNSLAIDTVGTGTAQTVDMAIGDDYHWTLDQQDMLSQLAVYNAQKSSSPAPPLFLHYKTSIRERPSSLSNKSTPTKPILPPRM